MKSGLGVAEPPTPEMNRPPDRRQVAAQEQVRRGLSDREAAAREKLARLCEVEERVCGPAPRCAFRPLRAGGHGRAGAYVREIVSGQRHAEARRRRPHVTGSAAAARYPVRYERERPGELLRTSTSRKWPACPTAAATAPWGRGCAPRGAQARPACTSPSTTSAGSPTPSCCCPTSTGKAPAARRSWAVPALHRGMGVRGRARDDRQRPGLPGGEFNALLESRSARHVYTGAWPGRATRSSA